MITVAFEELAQLLLAGATAVDIGGVEERDPALARGVDDAARSVDVEATAAVVAAEPTTDVWMPL